jgi:oligopeptide/dipeptide ABC transporter ATP-binding protein
MKSLIHDAGMASPAAQAGREAAGRVDAAALLSVRNLCVAFRRGPAVVSAVEDVSFSVAPGATLGVVGESGSGKSLTAMALLGLLPRLPGLEIRGAADFAGMPLLTASARARRALLGSEIGVVFQDPLTALNPVLSIGRQLTEVIRAHRDVSATEAAREAAAALDAVGIARAGERLGQFPHELSGGLRQRVLIAMAMVNRPKLIVADEPTTALDVTVQAQILDLLRALQRELGAAIVVISHDFGVIAELADEVAVMYAGRVVEHGATPAIFETPQHPYTAALLSCRPLLSGRPPRPIAGLPPDLAALPTGCAFAPRCAVCAGRARCGEERPALGVTPTGQLAACHFCEGAS